MDHRRLDEPCSRWRSLSFLAVGVALLVLGTLAGRGAGAAGEAPAAAGFHDPLERLDPLRFTFAHWANPSPPFACAWVPRQGRFENGRLVIEIARADPSDGSARGRPFVSAEMRSVRTYHWGRYEARVRAARGSGLLGAAFFLYAPDGDEIDLEIRGVDPWRVQRNWHRRGVGGHERMLPLPVDSSREFCTLGFEWLPSGSDQTSIRFLVEGEVVDEVTGPRALMPETPAAIMVSAWPGVSVDAWLGPLDFPIGAPPRRAEVDFIRFTPWER